MSIQQLTRDQKFSENGILTQRSVEWTRNVTQLEIITGVGSPEGVIEAKQTREYMDTTGTAGNIKYIKRDDDISGDRTMGWILI